MSATNTPELEPSGNDGSTDDEHTCPHGRAFCPVDNPDARADALECFDCFVEA